MKKECVFSAVTLLFSVVHFKVYTVLFEQRAIQLYGENAMHVVSTDWWKGYMIDEDIEPIMLSLFLVMLSLCAVSCYSSYKKEKGRMAIFITMLPVVSLILLTITKYVIEPMWARVI